jgi:hypothetical protein
MSNMHCASATQRTLLTRARLVALAAPFEPANLDRRCRWGLNAVKAMQVVRWFVARCVH